MISLDSTSNKYTKNLTNSFALAAADEALKDASSITTIICFKAS